MYGIYLVAATGIPLQLCVGTTQMFRKIPIARVLHGDAQSSMLAHPEMFIYLIVSVVRYGFLAMAYTYLGNGKQL